MISHPLLLVGAASALVALALGFGLGWLACLREAAKARPLRTACGDHPGNYSIRLDGTTAHRPRVERELERQGM